MILANYDSLEMWEFVRLVSTFEVMFAFKYHFQLTIMEKGSRFKYVITESIKFINIKSPITHT